jgi:hypothetical protein
VCAKGPWTQHGHGHVAVQAAPLSVAAAQQQQNWKSRQRDTWDSPTTAEANAAAAKLGKRND